MSAPERLSKRDAIRRENERIILAAAEKVFAEAGFGGATMQLIADMAGLPKANLHYYFATKEELYRRVVRQIFEIWLHAADSFDNAPGPVEGIGAYIEAKMDISRRHPFGSKVWASEVMHGAPVIQDYLETTLREWTEGRVAVIRRWIAAGRMAPVITSTQAEGSSRRNCGLPAACRPLCTTNCRRPSAKAA